MPTLSEAMAMAYHLNYKFLERVHVATKHEDHFANTSILTWVNF